MTTHVLLENSSEGVLTHEEDPLKIATSGNEASQNRSYQQPVEQEGTQADATKAEIEDPRDFSLRGEIGYTDEQDHRHNGAPQKASPLTIQTPPFVCSVDPTVQERHQPYEQDDGQMRQVDLDRWRAEVDRDPAGQKSQPVGTQPRKADPAQIQDKAEPLKKAHLLP
jgi:hypothetical protein